MHIHSAAMGLHSINTYAAANERSVAAQRAVEVRKRLAEAAQKANGGAGAEEALLIGRWLNPPHPDQPQSEVSPALGHRPATEGEDSSFA